MSSNYSIEQINEMIRKNEKKKKFFAKKIHLRFSDYIYDRKIHFSKLFEFFEMSRFDIMHNFYDFVYKRSKLNEDINLGNFVVVRVQCDSYKTLNVSIYSDIQVKTILTIHQKPLLEFEQVAFECENNLPLIRANIKIAIVDNAFEKVEEWDRDILLAILEFINIYGKEEEI